MPPCSRTHGTRSKRFSGCDRILIQLSLDTCDRFYVDEHKPKNPYNLEIDPHLHIDSSNYFMLSSIGVTHILHGKPDFAELEQWKREHYLFNTVTKMSSSSFAHGSRTRFGAIQSVTTR